MSGPPPPRAPLVGAAGGEIPCAISPTPHYSDPLKVAVGGQDTPHQQQHQLQEPPHSECEAAGGEIPYAISPTSHYADAPKVAVGGQDTSPHEPPRRKRQLEDKVVLESERSKVQKPGSHPVDVRADMSESFQFIPVLDYISKHPLTPEVIFTSNVTNILENIKKDLTAESDDNIKEDTENTKTKTGEDNTKEVSLIENTRTGEWLAQGYVMEAFAAHGLGISWAGMFDLTDMFASKVGRFVKIAKVPTHQATTWNRLLDLHNLVRCFFCRYKCGDLKRRPPYLKDFIDRIEKMMEEQKNLEQSEERTRETNLNFWMLENHPFFVTPLKLTPLFHAFYSSYKSIPVTERNNKVSERNKNTCGNWHVKRVRKDLFLYTVYWSLREDIPEDYLTRNPEYREGDNDYGIFPYTPADGYLGLFIRTCFVHGPEIIQEYLGAGYYITLKEMLSIVAYYFEEFMPAFLEDLARNCATDILLYEAIQAYIDRETMSWKALCAQNFAPPDSSATEKDESPNV